MTALFFVIFACLLQYNPIWIAMFCHFILGRGTQPFLLIFPLPIHDFCPAPCSVHSFCWVAWTNWTDGTNSTVSIRLNPVWLFAIFCQLFQQTNSHLWSLESLLRSELMKIITLNYYEIVISFYGFDVKQLSLKQSPDQNENINKYSKGSQPE